MTIEQPERPKVAVVLSSGGIKPLAAIPLFEFLDQARIPVDLLVGCSGGSIMSALRGCGYTAEQIRELIGRVARRDLFSSINLRALLAMARLPFGRFDTRSGLVRPARLRQALYEMFGDRRLEDLNPKTVIQTTEIQTGLGVILEEGPLIDAVYASSAVFPMLPPLEVNGRLLADGYYTSSLPVMEAVKRDMDVIIAVIFHDPVDHGANDYLACLSNYYTIQGDSITRFQLALSIELHHHEIIIIKVPFNRPINMWDVHHIPYIIETGQQVVARRGAEILDAVGSVSGQASLRGADADG
ncbi:patatin-like phospholipase family protein [Thiorhodovibrio frisius]|uniref:Putative esterase of the alpha-beta hydrolase superfamily n=1 Tax=Thiorhodovibrio frisius TaxID=631362 RepID=H8Z1N2_9GAMM|nr:patatin-like phospholipase family protein [Thiorhodovibrio frisius]EIC21477.1 putative esterase of the alpha-beta hydrolase superfamily [Thiorhodovibrio frisius]WPL24063.1 NTE family protein RssA [Thiorhodovibrio frisius]